MDKRFIVAFATFLLVLLILPLAGATYLKVLEKPVPTYVEVGGNCSSPLPSPLLESTPSATPSLKR